MRHKEIFIGIDPGQSGGIAITRLGGYAEAFKMPDTEADTAELLRDLKERADFALCAIESVHSMPKQGVASSFKFGRSYGFLRGLLIGLQIPFEEITPQVWQKEMNCRTGGDKNVSKSKAQQLWPNLKITHALADALLIAEALRRRNFRSA
jgi:hypothetical protein